MSSDFDGMKRVPEHVQESLKDDYVQIMKRHETALAEAYPVGLRFRKNYVENVDDFDAVYAIVRTEFSRCEYERLTWWGNGVVYSFYVYYKKLDKRGRPNGKKQVIDHRQFDAGCTVFDSDNEG